MATAPRVATGRGGYVVAAAGAAVGAVLLALAGGWLGAAYADRYMQDAGLEALIPFLVLLWVGFWLGAVAGCWIALRVGGHARSGTTALLLTVFLPPAIAASVLLFSLLARELGQNTVLPLAVGLVGGVIAARSLAVWIGRRRSAERAGSTIRRSARGIAGH